MRNKRESNPSPPGGGEGGEEIRPLWCSLHQAFYRHPLLLEEKKKQILEVRYRAEKRVEGMWFLVGGGVWQAQAVRNPGTVARTAEPKCPPNARAPMEVHFVPDPHQGAQHALAWD